MSWREAYPSSSLQAVDDASALTILDRRAGWPASEVELHGWNRDAYKALSKPRTTSSLVKLLAEREWNVPVAGVEEFLSGAVRLGLVFEENGQYIALATSSVPIRAHR
jgi:hypothetical protein